jgi:FlaA1/EpsC-like NDP-sugar epimerase
MSITELAKSIAPDLPHKVVGIRPGEKLHEQMIGAEDSYFTYEYPEYFKILPQINGWADDLQRIKDGVRVPEGFVYASDVNPHWMSDRDLRAWIDANQGSGERS